jgi:drug/metabolite transporter (DMT)-like permease
MSRRELRAAGGLGGGVVLALAIVYLVWGSTYLAIRYAIESIPPFTMAGLRFLVAGTTLYAFARLTGAPRPRRSHWTSSAAIGAFLLLGGNGGVVWAEQHVASGVTALLVAIEPVWIAVLAPLLLGHRRAGVRVAVGLIAGVAGVGVLVIDPRGLDPTSIDPLGAAVLVGAALSWAVGSLVSLRFVLPESRSLASGMQMLAGGILLALLGGLTGEWSRISAAAPSARSWAAFAYLVLFGSIIAFSAYAYLLRAARPTVAATYAFVNPVIAVLLGWAVGGEPLSGRVAVAAVLILAAVALLIGAERRKSLPAAEASAGAGPGAEPAPDPAAPRVGAADASSC